MFRSVNALDYMTAQPVVVKPDTNIFNVIHEIIVHKVSGASVVDENKKLVGVISEIDCLRAILDGSYYNQVDGTAADFMTAEVETVSTPIDILAVATRMVANQRRRIPVVENGKFIGQLSVRSILKAIKDFDVPEDKSER
ncbi:MAG: CBS domain-containing protein [Pseudomonadales bacterium]|nr:CBS domain-containing protein [Pseudomonadales bacterium]NRA16522.1 CBS domain-containing protein [Oceanospirillaceae bacterium]